MTYRDDLEAKKERAERIATELREVRRRMNAVVTLSQREHGLEGDLLAASRQAGEARARASLPLLRRLRIASPCDERWEEMDGDERTRHCSSCDKDVYDLSAMTAEAAESLLEQHGTSLCARFYRRADGTVMTSDCGSVAGPRRARAGAIGAGVAAAAGVVAIAVASMTPPAEPGHGPASSKAVASPAAIANTVCPPSPDLVPEPLMGGVIMGENVTNRLTELPGVLRPVYPIYPER